MVTLHHSRKHSLGFGPRRYRYAEWISYDRTGLATVVRRRTRYALNLYLPAFIQGLHATLFQ
jgi:hypothetical protein